MWILVDNKKLEIKLKELLSVTLFQKGAGALNCDLQYDCTHMWFKISNLESIYDKEGL